jgi:hypothetical protein
MLEAGQAVSPSTHKLVTHCSMRCLILSPDSLFCFRSEHRARNVTVAFSASPPTQCWRQWRAFKTNAPRWPWPAFRVSFDIWWPLPHDYNWHSNNCDAVSRSSDAPADHRTACETAQGGAPELRAVRGQQCQRQVASQQSHVVPRRSPGWRLYLRKERSSREWIRTPLHERLLDRAVAHC